MFTNALQHPPKNIICSVPDVCTIKGGTADRMAALATRLSPWRAMLHDLAAAGGMADMHGVFEVEMMGGQCREIVGIVAHVMTILTLCPSSRSLFERTSPTSAAKHRAGES
jgi:hypothetical protein